MVKDIPGSHLRVPDTGILIPLETDVEEAGGGLEYALLYRVVWAKALRSTLWK